jgi:hypothetical protein
MNRHERRRAKATRIAENLADNPKYIAVIEGIAYAYRETLARFPDREIPRFAFPPKDIMVICDLEPMIDRVARNEAALWFLRGIVDGARKTGDPLAFPTVFMLRVALESVGASIEFVSAGEFGIALGGFGN